MGLVLRKMVEKYLSNNNAQTRVGIEGQLAGLWFGPDEYLVEKKDCLYSLIFIKFPSPLNLYPWSKSRTEGLNISTKGLIHLFFTEDGDKMYFYGECFTIIESNCLYSEYLRRLMLNLLSGAQMLNSRASSGDCVLSNGTDEMFLPNASINNSETLHRLIYFWYHLRCDIVFSEP